jgi:hypothetical protein
MPLQKSHMCMLVHANGHTTHKGVRILTELVRSNVWYRTCAYCDYDKDRT